MSLRIVPVTWCRTPGLPDAVNFPGGSGKAGPVPRAGPATLAGAGALSPVPVPASQASAGRGEEGSPRPAGHSAAAASQVRAAAVQPGREGLQRTAPPSRPGIQPCCRSEAA